MGASKTHRKPASIELEEQKQDYAKWWTGKLKAQERAVERAQVMSKNLNALGERFPAVARIRSGIANPIAAAIDLGVSGINATKSYTDSVADSGIAMRAWAENSGGAKTTRAELEFQSAAVRKSIEETGKHQNTAASNHQAWDKELQLDSQLKEEMIDAELESQLAEIDSGNNTEAQKVQSRASARQGARRRKEDNAMEHLRREGDSAGMAALNAKRQREQAMGAAEALSPEIERGEQAAGRASNDAEQLEKQNAPQRKANEELIELIRTHREKAGGKVGSFTTDLLSLMGDKAGAVSLYKRFGNLETAEDYERVANELTKENSKFDEQKEKTQVLALKKRQAVEDQKKEQQSLFSLAQESEQTRVEAEARSEEKFAQYNKRKSARTAREAKLTEAEDIRTRKAVTEAEAKERNKFHGDGVPAVGAGVGAQSESVTSAGAAVVGAVTQNTQIIVGTLNALLEALQKQNTSIAAIQADIAKVTGGSRGTLRTS